MDTMKEMMVFDWNKAARLIRDRNPKSASAGLDGDLGHAGGEIYRSGEIIEDKYTYLASTWATPMLKLDGGRYECYLMQSEAPYCAEDTKWPKSARRILAGKPEE